MLHRIELVIGVNLVHIYYQLRKPVAAIALVYPLFFIVGVVLYAQANNIRLGGDAGISGIFIGIWAGLSGVVKFSQVADRIQSQPLVGAAIAMWMITYAVMQKGYTFNPELYALLPFYYIWFFGWPLLDLADLIMMSATDDQSKRKRKNHDPI